MDDFNELLRQANVLLGVVLISTMMMRLTRDWPLWSRRERVVRVHLIGYVFVISAGTFFLLLSLPEVWRILLVFIMNVSLSVALFVNRKDPVR
jgi:hypothetical protein